MPVISIRADMREVSRAFVDLRHRQLPFAASLALNTLAKGAAADEGTATLETFESPTPFTQKGFAVIPATKASLIAVLHIRAIAAEYLAPYIEGGPRSLGGKRAMLVPVKTPVNAFGNLPRGRLASLKAKPNVFVGKVGAKGPAGVYQRQAGKRPKLLIAFADTSEAPKRFDYEGRARAYLAANVKAAWQVSLARALATAR